MEQIEFKEEWRPVVGYEGIYEVSNTGRVDALNYHRGKCRKSMKIWSDKLNYRFVILYKNGEPHKMMIHRLVAMAFIKNPNNYPIINHKDENPSNNNVYNLEWCDHKYNSNYGNRAKKFAIKKNKAIIQLTKDWIEVARYKSFKEAQEKTGLRYTNISKVCRGEREFCGGYRWKYIDAETANRSRRNNKTACSVDNKQKRKTIYQEPVVQYTKKGEKIKEFETIYEAAKETGVVKRVILNNCRGINKSTRKYIFKYK